MNLARRASVLRELAAEQPQLLAVPRAMMRQWRRDGDYDDGMPVMMVMVMMIVIRLVMILPMMMTLAVMR